MNSAISCGHFWKMDTKGHQTVLKKGELRTMSCELNPLTRTDGSVLFSQGGTCVMGAILGPVEVKSQHLQYDRAYVDCIYRPRGGLPTVKDKIRETLIRDACEAALLTTLHPRTMFSIQLQELDDRGGLNACAINAACLAMLIGAVPMKYTIAAVYCGINKAGNIILDGDNAAVADCQTFFTFAFDSLERDIVAFRSVGSFKMEQFNKAYQRCRDASSIIFDFYRKAMLDFHNRNVQKSSASESPEKGEETNKDKSDNKAQQEHVKMEE